MSAIYRGYLGPEGPRVTVQREIAVNGRRRTVTGHEEPLQHHVRHSPTGFAWGYGGSGPADLARCILIDHLYAHMLDGPRWLSEVLAEDRGLPVSYQRFKREFVALWPWADEPAEETCVWQITDAEIEGWIFRQEDQPTTFEVHS